MWSFGVKKVAILIDGGYFLKRLPDLRPDLNATAASVAKALQKTAAKHLRHLNGTYNYASPWAMLYRIFYYDAFPYQNSTERPVSRTRLNFSKTPEATFREDLFDELRQKRKFALRLGNVVKKTGWRLTERASTSLRKGTLNVDELDDQHFQFGLRQKGVDMRIGVDIASIALKRQADILVLVAGDSDFVPAAKLARREGLEIILDPMGRSVNRDLYEHIDGLYNGLPQKRMPTGDEDGDVSEE